MQLVSRSLTFDHENKTVPARRECYLSVGKSQHFIFGERLSFEWGSGDLW